MAWSYSGNPASSNRDAVRFLIGDTDTADQQLSNEELDYLLTGTSPHGAAIQALENLARKYARMCDERVGQVSLSLSQRAEAYRKAADDLKAQRARGASPYAGGISAADKAAQDGDTDRVRPAFGVGLHENPQAQPELGSGSAQVP